MDDEDKDVTQCNAMTCDTIRWLWWIMHGECLTAQVRGVGGLIDPMITTDVWADPQNS